MEQDEPDHPTLDRLAVRITRNVERIARIIRGLRRFSRDGEPARVSYGPRRVLYPQLTSMREDEMALGEDAALIRDRNLIDEIVEFVEDLAIWLLARSE